MVMQERMAGEKSAGLEARSHTALQATERNLNFIWRSFKRGVVESDFHFRLVIRVAR